MNQTYSNIEIIVVDDGSTDKSGEIADALAKEDRRIKVVHQDNGGIGKACQMCLSMVTGDYVASLGSDDYMNPESYESLVKVAEETDADIVEFGITSYDPEGNYKGEAIPMEQQICGNESVIYDFFLLVGDHI